MTEQNFEIICSKVNVIEFCISQNYAQKWTTIFYNY